MPRIDQTLERSIGGMLPTGDDKIQLLKNPLLTDDQAVRKGIGVDCEGEKRENGGRKPVR
jgi:hypothetical protein